MKSQINEDFLKAYRKLPKHVRQQARKAYRLFRDDPQHPSLNFKPVHPNQPIYSARVSYGYRTIGIRSNNTIIWFWIGSHADYDQLPQNRRNAPEFIHGDIRRTGVANIYEVWYSLSVVRGAGHTQPPSDSDSVRARS